MVKTQWFLKKNNDLCSVKNDDKTQTGISANKWMDLKKKRKFTIEVRKKNNKNKEIQDRQRGRERKKN